MSIKVDPFLIPIPKALNSDPEVRKYFEYLNRFNHDMWVRSGGGVDAVAASDSDTNRKADTLLYAVLDKVNLGDPLTTDTTAFTTDSTLFTTDMSKS